MCWRDPLVAATGAITGNIVGPMRGDGGLPSEWVTGIEGRDVLLQLADDFIVVFGSETSSRRDASTTDFSTRYPAN